MGEVSRYQKHIQYPDVRKVEFISVSPPVSEREKEQGHTQDKVVESHVEQVVVCEYESDQREKRVCFPDAIEEIAQGQRQQPDAKAEQYLFANNGREYVHQRRQQRVRGPIWE